VTVSDYVSEGITVSYTAERLLTISLDGTILDNVELTESAGISRCVVPTESGYALAHEETMDFYDTAGTLCGTIEDCHCIALLRLPDQQLLAYYYVYELDSDGLEQAVFSLNYVDEAQYLLGDSCPLPAGMDVKSIDCDAAGTLYILNREDPYGIWPWGVYTLAVDSGELTLLFPWEDITQENSVQFMLAPYDQEQIFLTSLDMSSYVLSALLVNLTEATEAEAPAAEREELTLICWQSDTMLETLVREFNNRSETYTVTIRSFYEENDPEGSYQRMLTELGTGTGADLYYLPGLDGESLYQNGMLADIQQMMAMDAAFQTDAYYQTVWDALWADNGVYALYPFFHINALIGSNATLGGNTAWDWDAFLSFAQTLEEDVIPVRGITKTEVLNWVIGYDLPHYVDTETRTCTFDSSDFIKVLEFANSMPTEAVVLENYEIYQGRCALVPWGLSSVEDLALYASLYPDGFSAINYPSETGAITASCTAGFAMAAGADTDSGSWSFLKFLLSDEMQTEIFAKTGWPISKSAMHTLLQSSQLPVDDENSPFFGLENGTPLTDVDITQLEGLISQISAGGGGDETILSIVQEEAQAYFAGASSPETVASVIENRVEIYLSEQQ
jgi:ABC-type glycerol-3-phosphate transport system substrate-binding protein